jgi:WD40 repeat protein
MHRRPRKQTLAEAPVKLLLPSHQMPPPLPLMEKNKMIYPAICMTALTIPSVHTSHMRHRILLQRHPLCMYTASADTKICFWEISDRKGEAHVVATAHGHTDEVTGLVVYESLLLSSSNDGTVRLWDKTTADALRYVHVPAATFDSCVCGPVA